jgi:NAD(P)H dehydrogenase (quinone)
MPRILIVYDSREGVVYGMARAVAEGARGAGVDAILEDVSAAEPMDVLKYDGLVIGSPCFFGNVTGKVKSFIDATWGLRGKLVGKVGAGFTSERHLGGGAEHTLRAIAAALLTHGMIVQGDAAACPFGAVALDPTGDRGEVVAEEGDACRKLGTRVAELVKRLAGPGQAG